jgi:hypothetical protein
MYLKFGGRFHTIKGYDFLFSDFDKIHDGGILIFLCVKISTLATSNDSIANSHAD